MELTHEMLCKEMGNLIFEAFPHMKINCIEITNLKVIEALQKIKAALENDGLDDFMCVDEIIRIMESAGITIEARHDFG